MKKRKVAIIVRCETSKTCVGKGCLKAFFNKIDSFARYQDDELELVAFCNDDGKSDDPIENIKTRIEKFRKIGVDTVHLSSCIRARSPIYKEMIELFSEYFDVVGYTHGAAVRNATKDEHASSD